MVKSKLMFIRWGRGYRRYKVKNPNDYEKIGKSGRYNLYAKKKSVKRKTKTQRTQKEIKAIQRIKTGWTAEDKKKIAKEKQVEKRLLSAVKLVPKLDKKEFHKKINANGGIISVEKRFGSYDDLDKNKKDIYLNLLGGLMQSNNQKFKDKIYSMRKMLLKDGIVIELELRGMLNKGNSREIVLGNMSISGLMIEEADFIESHIVGNSGTIGEIERIADQMTRSRGGAGARIERSILKFDSTQIYITSVKIKLSYA